MPFIEVFDFSAIDEQRRQAADAITGGLQQAFAINAQIITTYFLEITPRDYAYGGVLMPGPLVERIFIKIHALRRPAEQKRKAASLVSPGVAAAYGINPSDIAIYFFDREADEIAHGGQLEIDRRNAL
jgi:phenylpyruvate tautomerase PptA (4-oxalocrotonate tautomerase family)